MGLKDIKTYLPRKYKILFTFLFLISIGLLITSTTEPLGFHLFGFILSLVGIVVLLVNSNVIAKKVLLNGQLQAGIISRDLFMEKISVLEKLPVEGALGPKVLTCTCWTV